VGLDIHVGFIVNTGDEVYFVHSSYVELYAVIREKAIESRVLASSNYRVLGNIFADDGLIQHLVNKKDNPYKDCVSESQFIKLNFMIRR
jgi:hypothetical protein